jgi:hypothetical protein|tara:strand:+ start:431 stop:541 length:111 start_codon:yes stop_codon:yes gene_type:complete
MEWGYGLIVMGVLLTQYFRYENHKEDKKEQKCNTTN